jgi:hypothetical protein
MSRRESQMTGRKKDASVLASPTQISLNLTLIESWIKEREFHAYMSEALAPHFDPQ